MAVTSPSAAKLLSLVKHFIAFFNKKLGKNVEEVSPRTMELLSNYEWPGNIRELRNILERAVIITKDTKLVLPDKLKPVSHNGSENAVLNGEILPLEEIERQHILRALRSTNWQIGGMKGAAKILQMNPSTLRSRMKRLEIDRN